MVFPPQGSGSGATASASTIAYGEYAYLITKVGNNFTSYDRTGTVFGTPGTDAGPVIRAVLTKLVVTDNVSGRIVFDPRFSYTVNTTVADATAGTSSYRFSNSGALGLNYAIGIPNGANPVTIVLDGLVPPNTAFDDLNVIPTDGVTIDLTTSISGMTTLTGGNNIVGIWHLIPATGFGNTVKLKNIRVRFPNNQRQNIMGIGMEYARNSYMEFCNATFNVTLSGMSAIPSMGAGIPNIGIQTMQSGHSLVDSYRNFAAGWQYGFDYLSEHLLSSDDAAMQCTYPFAYGGTVSAPSTYPVLHPSTWRNFSESECVNGPYFGAGNPGGAVVYIDGYDLEYISSGTWNHLNGATEASQANTPIVGNIRYGSILANVGLTYTEFWKTGHGGYVDTINLYARQNVIVGGGSTYTCTRSDRIIYTDGTGGAVTINLPMAADSTAATNTLTIYRIDNTANTVTITRAGSDTIQGANSIRLAPQYARVVLKARGSTTTWYMQSVSPNITQFQPADPAGTTSISFVMMGLGSTIAYTPRTTGNLEVTITAELANNTINDGVQAGLKYGTGTAPANGDANTGSAPTASSMIVQSELAGGKQFGQSLTAYIAGLTVLTAYWFDLTVAAITAGTANVYTVNCVIKES